ncbi:MAG: hypothetical protein MJY55_00835 [Bacteroidales bacterium]|nr:hypothetical protein [Bacteroidales bacterium]
MKKITIISAAMFLALAAISCQKEGFEDKTGTTVLNAVITDGTKTALGVKEGDAYPNYWKTGDEISVNGVASDALDESFDGKSSASFTFADALEVPYYAAYPASAVSDYDNGTAVITVPGTQKYVAGSYDPAAFILTGVNSTEGTVSMSAKVGIFHLSLTGEGNISKVVLSGLNGEALSGDFTTDFSALTPKTVSDKVELVCETPVALPAEFFLCIPAGTYAKLHVEVFDNDGGVIAKNATLKEALPAGGMFSAPVLAFNPSYDITIAAEGITSSTAVITWDNSPVAAYTINVYSDQGCSALVDSYVVPADDSCWSGVSPRFCISGLAAGTTYYVKVLNPAKSVESNTLTVTTADFTIVQVSDTPATEGDVILAEDFSELRWDCDMIGMGAGWFPTATAQDESFTTLDVDSYQAAATSSEKQLSVQTNPLLSSRLAHWAQGANRNMYIHPGYIKLVGSSKVTHLVTPALNNIPEGCVANLEVEVTASAYYSESSGSFATTSAIVAVQTEECGELAANATNALDLTSNKAAITLKEESAWNTYKVTLKGVAHGNRLIFGAASDVTKNNARMNISDMKVTITELLDPNSLTASLKGVTTSSAAFTWTHIGDASFDVSKPYTIALYSDNACSNKVISLQIPADASCWDGKQPCFVFGGLESGKTYYFRAEDTEDAGNPIVSNVVEATTGEFTNVAFNDLEGAATVGDVILAENFNEWGYGTDETLGAAGFYNDDATLAVYSGDVDMETVSLANASSTGRRFFHITKIWETGARIEQWGFAGNSSSYLRAGYLRMTTTSSSNRTHLVSPKLVAIPEGKYATIEVTAKMLRTESDNEFGVLVQTGTMNRNTGDGNPEPCYKLGSLSSSNTYAFPMTTKGSWETHTVTIKNITSSNSLAFGSINNIAGKNRFYISEITVKVTELYEETEAELKANCSDKSSSTLVFKWTEGGSADDDIANAYTATLYKDQACTQVDQTFDFPAEMGAWNGKQPCFVFGGLKPSTDYWFKVTDTTNGIESDPVKATTDDFTVVTLPSEITGTGIALAEDFGELRWDYEKCFGAAGYFPSSTSDFSNTSDPTFRSTTASSEKTFKGQGTALGNSRLNDWVTDSNVYIHPGSLKLGTSTARGWILTPEFKVPEGKKAVVNVTVTAARHDGSQDKDWAVIVLSPDLANANPSAHTADFSWPDVGDATLYQTINITNSSVWNTRTVSGLEIHSGDRIAFGGRQGGDGKKGRVWISDLTVEVTELVDE